MADCNADNNSILTLYICVHMCMFKKCIKKQKDKGSFFINQIAIPKCGEFL